MSDVFSWEFTRDRNESQQIQRASFNELLEASLSDWVLSPKEASDILLRFDQEKSQIIAETGILLEQLKLSLDADSLEQIPNKLQWITLQEDTRKIWVESSGYSNWKDKYGLNTHLISSLQEQGIQVEFAGKDGLPYINTENLYFPLLDNAWNMRSGRMSSLPIIGKYIESIGRTTDGVTTFNLVDVATSQQKTYIFWKEKWENAPKQMQDYYKNKIT